MTLVQPGCTGTAVGREASHPRGHPTYPGWGVLWFLLMLGLAGVS
jgi:hypothetical protein